MSSSVPQTARRFLLVTLAGAFFYAPAGHLATPDAHLQLAQARAWTEGRVALPADVGNPGHGNVAITDTGDRYAVYNAGLSVIYLAPWVAASLLPRGAVPVDQHYIAAFFASFVGPLAHFTIAWLLFELLLVLRRSVHSAVLSALVFGFATASLPHSMDGYQHPVESLSMVASLYCCVRANEDSNHRRWALIAGVLLGMGAFVRTTVVLALPGLAILLRQRRLVLVLLCGLAPFLALNLGYNYIRFGSPFETGYLLAWKHSSHGPTLEGQYFGYPLLKGLFGLWFSSGKGMFIFSPVLLACICGLPRILRNSRGVFWMVTLTTLGYSLLYAKNWAWHGSPWCWGPRYILPLVPLLMLGFPTGLRSRLGLGALILLTTASFSLQSVGLVSNYKRALLTKLTDRPQVFDDGAILFDPRESIVFEQFKSAAHVLSGPAGTLYPYIQPGPWRNEGRPATIRMVLDSSVDLNVPNFWWVRMQWLPVSDELRSASLTTGLAGAAVLLWGLGGLAWTAALRRSPPQ